MGRTEQRRQYQSIIRYQLETKEPKTTTEYYQELLQAGYHEERIIQLMAYVLETYTKAIIGSNQPFSEYEWKSYLHEVKYTVVNEKAIPFDERDARYNIKRIKKEYGDLKGQLQIFVNELMTIEESLYMAYLLFDINEVDAVRIIHIVIQTLLDEMDHTQHQFEDYVQEDLLFLAKNILYCTDPYLNKDLKNFIEQFMPVDEAHMNQIFKPVLLCLVRIIEKIEQSIKKRKSYFKTLETYIKVDYSKGPSWFFNDSTLMKKI